MSTYALTSNKNYQITARTVAGVVGVVLLVLFFYKMLEYFDPPLEQSGILVSFGQPNIGQGDEVSAPPAAADEPEESEPEESEPEVSEPEPVDPTPDPEPIPDPEPDVPTVDEDVVEDTRSKEIALKKKKEQEKKREEERIKRQKELEAQKKKDAEEAKKREEARKKAEEEARKKAEAEKLKGEIGGLFGQSGDGKGETGTSGNQGDPNGDPNASNLEGVSTGSGMVGGGLSNRGGRGPAITDKSQEQGKIVVEVCVDENGRVTKAEYKLRGSTSQSSTLKRIAIANAKKWSFNKGEMSKQCGTITYDFKLK